MGIETVTITAIVLAIKKSQGKNCLRRVEHKGEVDFLAKYVRPDKIDGLYLPEISGKEAIWNWRPNGNIKS